MIGSSAMRSAETDLDTIGEAENAVEVCLPDGAVSSGHAWWKHD